MMQSASLRVHATSEAILTEAASAKSLQKST